jgi:hypothetical protein
MTIPDIIVIGAAALAVIELFNTRGRSFPALAILLLCIAYLWPF